MSKQQHFDSHGPEVDLEKDGAKTDHHEYKHDNASDEINSDTTMRQDIDEGFDPAEVKKLTRRIDFRLIPVLASMYAISLVDRTNLAIARAANDSQMDKDLGTGGLNNRYSIITLVFFIPYIIFELPLGLRKFGARWWLGSAVVAWGIVMIAMGFAPNWSTLAALRAVLGVFESALFPGAAYLISCWYPRKEMATRNVVFYISSAVTGSFAKPLGYCFSLLHGKSGKSGWEWIFLIYGIVTVLIGIMAYFLIVDFPDRAKFLDEHDRHIVLTRIQRDRADAEPDPMTMAKVLQYSMQWRPWAFAFFFMSTTTASYSLAYFLPTILKQMGFGNVESMLLGTPAYFWALVPALGCGYIADHYRNMRAWVVVLNSLCIVVGTLMYSQLPLSQKAARFAGIFFAVGGANSNVPLIIAWQHTAIRSQSKRGFCSALSVAFGGIGGIFGSALFMQKEAKQGYPTGIWFTVGVNAATLIGAALVHLYMRSMNKRADAGRLVIEGHPGFRYQP